MPFPNPDTQFQPGQSGNPEGMKPGTKHLKTLLKALLELNDGNTSVLEPENPQPINLGRQIMETWLVKAREGDWKAAQAILEQLEGKATQPIGNDPENPLVSPEMRVVLVKPGSNDAG